MSPPVVSVAPSPIEAPSVLEAPQSADQLPPSRVQRVEMNGDDQAADESRDGDQAESGDAADNANARAQQSDGSRAASDVDQVDQPELPTGGARSSANDNANDNGNDDDANPNDAVEEIDAEEGAAASDRGPLNAPELPPSDQRARRPVLYLSAWQR